MSKEVPKTKSSVPVPVLTTPEVKKTFLDDITSFISKNKYPIAIIAILAGVCVYYYIKSKQRQEVPQIHHPQVLNEDFGFPDDPAYNNRTQMVEPDRTQQVEPDKSESLSVSSLDTVEIGENESKILSMEDISVNNKEGTVEDANDEMSDQNEEIIEKNEAVSEYEVYRSGPRKGQRKEKKQPARRRRRKADS